MRRPQHGSLKGGAGTGSTRKDGGVGLDWLLRCRGLMASSGAFSSSWGCDDHRGRGGRPSRHGAPQTFSASWEPTWEGPEGLVRSCTPAPGTDVCKGGSEGKTGREAPEVVRRNATYHITQLCQEHILLSCSFPLLCASIHASAYLGLCITHPSPGEHGMPSACSLPCSRPPSSPNLPALLSVGGCS